VALAALAADMPSLHPIGLQAVLGAAVVSSVGVTLGAAAYRHGGAVAGLVRVVQALPAPLARCCGPVAAALAVQLGAAAVVLAALLGLGHARVVELHHALQPGAAGGAVLTLAQVLVVPNLVLWTASALIGPGFGVGTGSWITLSTSKLGALPALPVLGALPDQGRLPVAALALLGVPVLAGVVAGMLLARSEGVAPSFGRRAGDVACVAVLAGAVMTVLAWLSGGPAGPGRLADIGPVPWLTGLAFAAEVAAGTALALAARSTAGAVRGGAMRRANG
jgi:hypothetical protein